jgi:hypothetical protein
MWNMVKYPDVRIKSPKIRFTFPCDRKGEE